MTLSRVLPDEPDVALLLQRHFDQMRAQTPAESCHVLPAAGLEAENIHLFALRRDGRAVAVGAIKVSDRQGELKSMHTAVERRGQGLGREILRGLMEHAHALGVTRLVLETGSGPEHLAARSLYASEGFEQCAPFGDYSEDPLSHFMARAL
jgi:putative acetyltransferase